VPTHNRVAMAKCELEGGKRYDLRKLEWQALQIGEGVAFEDWCLTLTVNALTLDQEDIGGVDKS